MRSLPVPTEATSLETAAIAITGLGVFGSRLVVLPGRAPGVVLNASFQAGKDTRLAAFGALTNQERLTVVEAPGDWDLVGTDLSGGRLLFFEGLSTTIIEAEAGRGKRIVQRSVPWDLIRPPADRGGEATAGETAELRRAFKRAWLATTGLHIVGLARLPQAWQRGAKPSYLLATRVKGYPLVQMECEPGEPSACLIVRQCHLEGAKDLQPTDIAGIGISEAQRLVVLGDRQRRLLLSFAFNSCYDVPRRSTSALPPQLKTLTNLTIDAADRLWLTTSMPDDYLNASVFFWPKGTW